ncbi:D-alanine--D-alanine ligase family protein [Anaeromicropila herbilytica]|uniref:D-alanine--D-alanine ligase n=1 Tax=Anaeromicropila herbilytica TaxID=2785025 RepID=A0A7R7EHL0_9FIRM|nr:D-alanine--D-alanine ligase family protein [Anaeromicropila herbilytica]BCN28816.1 D-alanine--D-alanine ligase [Anaeromicropila herbilytica]
MSKKTVAVIFGGQSSEHEVSLISATTIISNINKDYYDIVMIGITKEGKWLKVDSIEDITSGAWKESKVGAIISPDATNKGVLLIEKSQMTLQKVDVVFPALHGMYGEDGTIQGLLELAKIPYVGCGVVASGVSMDKFYTKIIVDTLDVRQAEYVPVLKGELKEMDAVVERIESKLSYPVFVKPSNAGSSQGVSKASDRDGLVAALELAAKHDKKILVEETIIGREIECAVLGGRDPKASGVGEILAAADFYDYDAKYNNAESKTVINPELPEGVAEEVRDKAVRIFKAVDGYGLSRVDFFLEKGTNEVVFNEINTLPGFTSISMYPMLWEAKGIGKQQLVEKLIQLAFARSND